MALRVRDLDRDDWPVVRRLFGPNGACGGCWCMAWRWPRGGKLWTEKQGEPNRRAFRELVADGRAKGALAFVDDEPVGWCSVGPRADFVRLQRSRVLATDWDTDTWSVTCFYIPARWRGHGVATALARHAVDLARRGGARRLEAYPVKPARTGKAIPAAFAWTGVAEVFERAGFRDVSEPGRSRPIWARDFRPPRRRR